MKARLEAKQRGSKVMQVENSAWAAGEWTEQGSERQDQGWQKHQTFSPQPEPHSSRCEGC